MAKKKSQPSDGEVLEQITIGGQSFEHRAFSVKERAHRESKASRNEEIKLQERKGGE
jgi:hypothetical protein